MSAASASAAAPDIESSSSEQNVPLRSDSIGITTSLNRSVNNEMVLNFKNIHSTSTSLFRCDDNAVQTTANSNDDGECASEGVDGGYGGASLGSSVPINVNNPFLSDNGKRDEHQKTALKICLVVSPPSGKLLQV